MTPGVRSRRPPPNPQPPVERIGAVIVTHDSEAYLELAVESLLGGRRTPDQVVIVDSGSADPAYVRAVGDAAAVVDVRVLGENVGFCRANNIGLAGLSSVDAVLFLNPDTLVTNEFLDGASRALEQSPEVGAIGPLLERFDPTSRAFTGVIDSAGIAQSRWGRFFDRCQGDPVESIGAEAPGPVLALCAAAVLVRGSALRSVEDSRGRVFDEAFYMYKEDVDLSLRLRASGWQVWLDPELRVGHARGWNQARRRMARAARRRSVRNDWRIFAKRFDVPASRFVTVCYLGAKSVAVRLGL